MTEIRQTRGAKPTVWRLSDLPSLDDENIYILSDREISILLTAITPATWSTRWLGATAQDMEDVITGMVGRLNYRLMNPIDLCAVIQTCIGEQLTALQNSINDVASDLSDVAQDVADIDNRVDTLNTQNNARQPDPVTVSGCDETAIFSGAIFLVQRFNQMIVDIFQQAEAQASNSQQELLAIVFEAIPGIETLPVDELWELSNWFFENQQTEYEGAYNLTFEEKAACELFCLILANDCVLNTAIIGEWLDGIVSAIPNNKAAEIFGKFAPSAQTFVNQVNQLVQGTQSLQSFFDDLHRQYAVGTLNQYPVPPSCACGSWAYLWDFTLSDGGWYPNQGGNQGVWQSGQGIVMQQFDGGGGNLYVLAQWYKDVASDFTATSIEIVVEAVLGGNIGGRFVLGDFSPNDPNQPQNTLQGTHTYTFNLEARSNTGVLMAFARASHDTFFAGSGRIISATLRGDGVPPALTGGQFI